MKSEMPDLNLFMMCEKLNDEALISHVMKGVDAREFPVFLHTQLGSYRAIKLYSDFGFALLTDDIIGLRENHLQRCLPILQEYMPHKDFEKLSFAKAPKFFLEAVSKSQDNRF